MKLYEITNEFLELFNNEEVTEDEANKIGENLAIALRNKSTDIVGYYLNENSDIEQIDNQIKRLQEMKKAKQNRLDKFKEYVKTNMEKLDLKNIETELGKITIAKSPISVEITDKDKVPAKYKSIVQDIKIDKTAIANDFKDTGELIDGVIIHTENTNLRIK